MRFRKFMVVSAAILLLASTASFADLAGYSQDFEALDPAPGDPGSLGGDGWLAFVNVFDGGGGFLYNYGPFPTPQGGPAFAGVAGGEGGPEQGLQQLSIYNDYNNVDHANGFLIEANVFQEQIVGAADVGNTWRFEFDAKRGNIEGSTTALAFIKTLDPNNGFALTNFITVDTTNLPTTWDTFSRTILITPSLEGQILQFGFLNTATLYQGSGVFYDNVNFSSLGVLPVPTVSQWGLIVMGLLLLSAAALVFSTGLSTATSGGNGAGFMMNVSSAFDSALYLRVLAVSLGLLAFGLVTTWVVVGPVSAVDVTGSLLSVPLVAFLVHLWMGPRKD